MYGLTHQFTYPSRGNIELENCGGLPTHDFTCTRAHTLGKLRPEHMEKKNQLGKMVILSSALKSGPVPVLSPFLEGPEPEKTGKNRSCAECIKTRSRLAKPAKTGHDL